MPPWLPMSDAMRHAGVRSRHTMRKLLRSGVIYGETLNDRGDWRIDQESIDTYLNRGRARALAILKR